MRSFESVLGDLRHAVRRLVRDKGFTATVLFTFALCLGANVALFAVVNAVLLKPLPFPEADRLAIVYNAYPKAGVERAGASVPHYLERRAHVRAFVETAAYRGGGQTLGESGAPDRVDAMTVTPSFFRVLGVAAATGRVFSEEEGNDGRNDVVLLGDSLWRQKFGADPNVIGRQIRLEGGRMCTVVGVMPPGFRFLSSRAQLWLPMVLRDDDRKPQRRHSNNMEMIARLHPGASLREAEAQVATLNNHPSGGDPFAQLVVDAGFTTHVAGLQADYVKQLRPAILLLQAGVLLLLLIGVVNVTNLLLVRVSSQAKDYSVREVLGASRGRIAREVVTETLLLAFVGALLGLALGWAGLRGLDALGLDPLPRAGELRLDATVAWAGSGASLLVGLVLAVPLIWHLRQRSLATALTVESRGGTTTRATLRLRHTLIVAQFALAFVLLAGAGLLGRSFSKVLAVNPGFQAENVLTGLLPLPWGRYKEVPSRVAFIERLQRELAAVPGVTAVGFGNPPFSGSSDNNAISVEGRQSSADEPLQAHNTAGVTGDYFTAVGIPLREGRLLNADDSTRESRVCVVDEVVAQRYWPGRSALGGRLFNGPPGDAKEAFTVVGVVGAILQADLASTKKPGAVYFPYFHYASLGVGVALRTTQAPAAAGPAVRAAVLRVDPELPLDGLKTLGARIDESLGQRRAPLFLAGLFAAVALLLAGVGLYGVLAYAVAQRRREIGVRMALGAQPGQIRTQFLGLGARLVATGAVLGALGSWLSGEAMSSLLFGVAPADPLVLAATAALLATLALLACFLPAARAARVPPMEALRSD